MRLFYPVPCSYSHCPCISTAICVPALLAPGLQVDEEKPANWVIAQNIIARYGNWRNGRSGDRSRTKKCHHRHSVCQMFSKNFAPSLLHWRHAVYILVLIWLCSLLLTAKWLTRIADETVFSHRACQTQKLSLKSPPPVAVIYVGRTILFYDVLHQPVDSRSDLYHVC